MKKKLFILCVFYSSCIPSLQRNVLEWFSLTRFLNTASSASLRISYSGSPFSFTQNLPINTITPTVTGTIKSCSSSPTLPTGLAIEESSCSISGTPTTTQPTNTYKISATNGSVTTTTEIDISINLSPPSNLVYANHPFTFSQNIPISSETPSMSGTASSCSSSPTLPVGLTISNTCILSGTPTTLQPSSSYTITASNAFGSTTTIISISIITGIFHFDFASSTLVETGGSGLTLVAVGAPSPIIGKDGDSNGGYSFDGTSQYLTISNPAGLPTSSSARTYCLWVNPTATPNNSVILSQGSASIDNSISISLNSSYPSTDVSISTWGGSTVSASYTPKINTWQHICGTLSGSNVNIYIDGKLIGPGVLPNVNTTISSLNVGANVDFNNKFTGKIDDIRIYKYVLSATQIRQLAVQIPSNLLARYDFNGNPGDTSGNNNSLTSFGPLALTIDRYGSSSSAYTFNGAAKFSTSAPVTTSVTGNVTLSAWIRPTNFNPSVNFIVVNGSGSDGYGIVIDGTSGNVLKGILGGWGYISSTIVPPLYVWSHVALIANGTNWDLRLNGVSIATLAATPPNLPTVGTFIGSDSNTAYFTGDIDDVRIYSMALTPAEILILSGYHPMQVSSWTNIPATSSLKVHFQADSLSNLSNGSLVNSWNDDSGNANHVTAVNPPTFSNTGLNSKPAISFVRASNQHLVRAGSTGLTGSNYAVMSVFNPTLVGQALGIFSIASACASYDKEQIILATDYIEAGLCNIISVFSSTDPVVSGNSYIDTFNYAINSTANLYLNGKLLANFATPATAFSSANYNIGVGTRLAQGAMTAFNGNIAEILYFDGAISSANRVTVECYLSAKYNIPLDPSVSCP